MTKYRDPVVLDPTIRILDDGNALVRFRVAYDAVAAVGGADMTFEVPVEIASTDTIDDVTRKAHEEAANLLPSIQAILTLRQG